MVAAIGILQVGKTPAQSGWADGAPVFESDVERRRSERDRPGRRAVNLTRSLVPNI